MAQTLNLKISGLYTHPNPFSEVPEGALSVADNVVIDKDSTIETRRGQKQYGDQIITSSTTVDRMFEYQNTLIAHHDSTLKYDSDGAGTWSNYTGTFAHPDSDYLMRSFQHKKNFYFTTAAGVKVLDLITNDPVPAGAYKALGGVGVTTGATGFMTDDTAIAYRIVWGRVDVNDNLVLGTPSQRVIVTNSSGGTRNGSLTFDIPDGVTTNWKYQVYRSGESATAATTPDDELQLVYENNPTAGEITAQSLTVTDTTPDSLKGAALYTNQTQQTILQTNDEPPFCKDMTEYKGYTLYANTKTKHRYTLDMIAVGATEGVQIDDTITVDGNIYTGKGIRTFAFIDGDVTVGTDIIAETAHGMTTGLEIQLTTTGTLPAGLALSTNYYIIKVDDDSIKLAASYADAVAGTPAVDITAAASGGTHTVTATTGENALANEFYVDETGTPAQNIDATTLSLIKIVNQDILNTTVYAYYLSGFEDAPGKILFEEKAIGGSSFPVISSRSTCWIPRLPSSGTTESSVNDEFANRIYVSKVDQPEAVPLLNYFSLGSANSPIQRIVALRDSVIVFKEDGIFRVTGQSYPFNSFPFNNSIRLQGKESAVVLDNRIYAMSDQGVVAVHDSGIEVISRPVEASLVELLGDDYTHFKSTAFAVGYESDRRYILYTVTETTDTAPTQAWAYNTITRSWTRWTTPRSAGIVKINDDKLYTAHSTSDYVYKERKNFNTTDYADEQYPINIVSYAATVITLTTSANVVVGHTITQGTINGLVTAISGNDVTVNITHTWASGAATTNNPIVNTVEWVEETGGNIGLTKQFQECTFVFRKTGFEEITALFSGNFIDNETVTLVPLGRGATWGGDTWGAFTWGENVRATLIRTFVPRNAQRSNWLKIKLTLNESYTSFSLAGVSIMFREIDSKFK